ncbi:MAG: hypothetical protein AAGB19_14375, partial [Cyanobacteria bacterium P01_F01_bin.3]
SGQQAEKEMGFITRHALRTLVKQGDPDALALLGFGGKPEIDIVDLETSTPIVVVGDAFEFAFTINSHKAQKLMVDYIMRFQPAPKSKKESTKLAISVTEKALYT